MTQLQSIILEHTPSSHSIHLALFRQIRNAAFILQQLRSGNSEYEYAFIDARVIISSVHVFAACFQAISNQLLDKLRTRNVHSEVIFGLSPKNNIAASFINFGVTAQTSNLLVIKIGDISLQESISHHLKRVIEGVDTEFSDTVIAGITDWNTVKKLYNLGGTGLIQVDKKQENTPDEEKQVHIRELEVLILGAMALRGATN